MTYTPYMGKGSGEACTRPSMSLVPSDFFDTKAPDEHFAEEAKASQALGMKVGVFEDENFRQGHTGAFKKILGDDDCAVYRGWMMGSEEYARFHEVILQKGITLRTSPDNYRAAHELPGWYSHFHNLTPRSVWTEGETDEESFRRLLADMPEGSAVLKDYVKSLKHQWDSAMFIPDTRNEEQAIPVYRRFMELREAPVGGLVLREYEQFTKPEVRSWWVNGECRLVTPHPDTPDERMEKVELERIQPAVQSFGAPFVSVDLVRNTSGELRVIEVGDGQVSDRPRTVDARTFMEAIL